VGVGKGRGVGIGVGEYPGAGVGVKPFTTGGVPTGVGLADFWRSLVGSALGLTKGRTLGLATGCVGTSAPGVKNTNSIHPIRKSTPIP